LEAEAVVGTAAGLVAEKVVAGLEMEVAKEAAGCSTAEVPVSRSSCPAGMAVAAMGWVVGTEEVGCTPGLEAETEAAGLAVVRGSAVETEVTGLAVVGLAVGWSMSASSSGRC
jgi:hypothetical protein